MVLKKIEKAIKRWQKENLKLSPPNSEKEIIDCFHRIESLLSKDILEL